MKMKKLLAAALAATMLFSTMVTSVVASAETPSTVVTIADVAVGAEEYTADIDINFGTAVTAPHLMLEITATGAIKSITSDATELIDVNTENGKVIVETNVQEAASVEALNLDAVFTLDPVAAAGNEITVTVAVTEAVNVDENDIEVAGGSDTYTVVAPHECDMQTKYDENGHWTECECGEKTDVVDHTFGDAAEGEDGKWYKSCECGYSEEVEAPVVECAHEWGTGTVIVPSSTLSTGEMRYVCSLCSEEKVEIIPVVEASNVATDGLITVYSTNALHGAVDATQGMMYAAFTNIRNAKKALPADALNIHHGVVITGAGYEFKSFAATSSNGYSANVFGLAVTDFDTEWTFQSALFYTDANGVPHLVEGAACTMKLIDALNAAKELGTEGYSETELANIDASLNMYTIWSSLGYPAGSAVAIPELADPDVIIDGSATITTAPNLTSYYDLPSPGDCGIYTAFKGYKTYYDANNIKSMSNYCRGIIITGGGYTFRSVSTSTSNSTYGNVSGLALTDLNTEWTFTPYIQYTDSEGTVCRVTGEAHTLKLIDLLRNMTRDQVGSDDEYELGLAMVAAYDLANS